MNGKVTCPNKATTRPRGLGSTADECILASTESFPGHIPVFGTNRQESCRTTPKDRIGRLLGHARWHRSDIEPTGRTFGCWLELRARAPAPSCGRSGCGPLASHPERPQRSGVGEPAFGHANWRLQAKGYAMNSRERAIARNKVPCMILASFP